MLNISKRRIKGCALQEERDRVQPTRRVRLLAVLAAVLTSGVLAALVLAVALFGDRTPPPGPYAEGFGPATSTYAHMAVAGVLLTAWGASVKRRCLDAQVGRFLLVATTLQIWVMLIIIVKYSWQNDDMSKALWYLTYVPLVFTPTFLLFAAMKTAGFGEGARPRAVRRACIVVSCFLVALVLTNRLHGLVFVFAPSDSHIPFREVPYGYSYGYWLVYAWIALLFLACAVLPAFAARKRLRSAFLPLVLIAFVGVLYSAAYILKVDFVFRGNFYFTYMVFVVASIEFCLRTGLIPSYAWYGDLFASLPLDLRVFSRDLRPAFSTRCAHRLSPSESDALSHVAYLGRGDTVRLSSPAGTTRKAFGIAGGIAYVVGDASVMESLRCALESKRTLLERRRALLKRRYLLHERLLRRERERELFEDVRSSLSWSTEAIEHIISSLPEGSAPEARAERLRAFMLVKLLLAYGKRRGRIVLDESDGRTFDAVDLRLVAEEIVVDMRSVGIECAALVEIESPIAASAGCSLYDCVFDVAIAAFRCIDPVIMLYVRFDAGALELRCSLEASAGSLADVRDTACARLDQRGERYRVDLADDSLVLVVSCSAAPEEGGRL